MKDKLKIKVIKNKELELLEDIDTKITIMSHNLSELKKSSDRSFKRRLYIVCISAILLLLSIYLGISTHEVILQFISSLFGLM